MQNSRGVVLRSSGIPCSRTTHHAFTLVIFIRVNPLSLFQVYNLFNFLLIFAYFILDGKPNCKWDCENMDISVVSVRDVGLVDGAVLEMQERSMCD
jgi:hypothetical protein